MACNRPSTGRAVEGSEFRRRSPKYICINASWASSQPQYRHLFQRPSYQLASSGQHVIELPLSNLQAANWEVDHFLLAPSPPHKKKLVLTTTTTRHSTPCR